MEKPPQKNTLRTRLEMDKWSNIEWPGGRGQIQVIY